MQKGLPKKGSFETPQRLSDWSRRCFCIIVIKERNKPWTDKKYTSWLSRDWGLYLDFTCWLSRKVFWVEGSSGSDLSLFWLASIAEDPLRISRSPVVSSFNHLPHHSHHRIVLISFSTTCEFVSRARQNGGKEEARPARRRGASRSSLVLLLYVSISNAIKTMANRRRWAWFWWFKDSYFPSES